jgi:hypothetical protein
MGSDTPQPKNQRARKVPRRARKSALEKYRGAREKARGARENSGFERSYSGSAHKTRPKRAPIFGIARNAARGLPGGVFWEAVMAS